MRRPLLLTQLDRRCEVDAASLVDALRRLVAALERETGDRPYASKYMNSTRAIMPSDSSASSASPSHERSIRRNSGNGGAPPRATVPQRGHLPSVYEGR